MAPTTELDVIILYPWELFTAIKNGQPCIGARLWTFAANTTTPKAAYHDPYYLNPQTNPIVMNDQGQAVVWLDGFYHLRLEDADGVLLWEMLSYEFVSGADPPPPGLLSGMNEATGIGPSAGTGVILVPNLVPLGYRVEGVLVRIDTDFGASQGLTQLAIGDGMAGDRWGVIGRTAGLSTGQRDWHAADRPIAATAYTILISSVGGTFDATGSLTCRAFWSSITGWS
jgi:hypothetical protein